MKCFLPVMLVYVLSIPEVTRSKPMETTTARSTPTIGESIKQLTNQLMELNATSDVVLDTRTPPRVKQQIKEKESIENSHAGVGVAVPVDDEEVFMDESTKKMHFYKLEKPTTNSGLSTWILLSGQTQPPPTTVTKIAPSNKTVLVTEAPVKMKPIFKRRSTTTTTRKPTTTKAINTTNSSTELNKIKAAILTNAMIKKGQSSTSATTEKLTTTSTSIATTEKKTKPTKETTKDNENINSVNATTILPLEAKDGEVELTTNANDKRTRRPSTKRKKNKNKKRKPSDKTSNSTKIASTKEKPIGTQLYNYLSREVMPTVGVGLVGLMVTAGLASYFLYPFGIARRSYEIDRKDKEGYYYNDYDSGIAEEEAIGKVIAGMPANYNDNYNNYRKYNQRNVYTNVRRTQTYPDSPFQHYDYQQDSYQNINYKKDIIEQNKETGYTVSDRKFFVGNAPKEAYQEATPAAVPEHGPRKLRVRKRRQVNDTENDIFSDTFPKQTQSTTEFIPTTEINVLSTPQETDTSQKVTSFVELMRDLFHLKINLGIELLQNATETVSRYLTRVQMRLEDHYRENQRTNMHH